MSPTSTEPPVGTGPGAGVALAAWGVLAGGAGVALSVAGGVGVGVSVEAAVGVGVAVDVGVPEAHDATVSRTSRRGARIVIVP
jgi:hypothetical protein